MRMLASNRNNVAVESHRHPRNEAEEEDDDGDNGDDDNMENDDTDDDAGAADGAVDLLGDEQAILRTFTYPRDFDGSRFPIRPRVLSFRVLLDPACTEIVHQEFRGTVLDELLVPAGSRLVRIERQAFSDCVQLRRIRPGFPPGLLYLEASAFHWCSRLAGSLMVPSSVVFVGRCCFLQCVSITRVVFAPSIDWVLLEGGCVFANCSRVRSVVLPTKLRMIPPQCFEECLSLRTIPIPATVTAIARKAFKKCTNLTRMDLPESIMILGAEVFTECRSLERMTIRTVSPQLRIGDNVFRYCPSLSTIHVYPWMWEKLLRSMKEDATFVANFLNGTFTPLWSINVNSWYGSHLFESVNDQPNSIYRILRELQHQLFYRNK